MTIILWIALGVFLVSMLILLTVALRHVGEVQVVNTDTDERAKSRKKKEEIILQRLSRGASPAVKIGKIASASLGHLRRLGRRSIHRLKDLETHYQDLKYKGEATTISKDQLSKVLEEASQLVRDEEYALAEKKYIEVISVHPKEVKAYEYLGRLYIKMKQYDQADQCLRFAVKLRPDDASVHASLGELYMNEEQWTRAVEELGRAIEKRPGNPKYLDRYLEATLGGKRADLARKGLDQLKASNPENQKIEEFEARIEALQ